MMKLLEIKYWRNKMKNPATEAIEEIQEANKLPNRTKKALAPESDEDRAMYDVEQKDGE